MSGARRRALVFAGAGASFAVSKELYPTTVQFYERLPESIRDHKLVRGMVRHLATKFGEGTPDVEKILWCLDELGDYLGKVEDATHPASWFIPNNSLHQVLHGGHETAPYAATARHGVHVVADLKSEISAKVYDYYSALPAQEQIQDNWLSLLELLAAKNYVPDVITTNYDLVIEHAAHIAGKPIEYGRGAGVVTSLDLDVWKQQLSEDAVLPANGLLTKLHGSLNWLREADRIILGGTQFKGNHKYHGVIYPGYKGVPQEDPFSLMHSYFERALQSADVIIFVGFAFRDEYINTCLERSAGSKPIYVVDPAAKVHVPKGLNGNLRHINYGFGRDAMSELQGMI